MTNFIMDEHLVLHIQKDGTLVCGAVVEAGASFNVPQVGMVLCGECFKPTTAEFTGEGEIIDPEAYDG